MRAWIGTSFLLLAAALREAPEGGAGPGVLAAEGAPGVW